VPSRTGHTLPPHEDDCNRHFSEELTALSECVPNKVGSRPMLAIQSDTSLAYCRVEMPRSGPRRPVNRNSPGFLPAHLMWSSTDCRVSSVNSNRTACLVFFCRTVARSIAQAPGTTSSTFKATRSHPPKLAVDRQVEYRKVPRSAFHLQLGSDRPNMFWTEWRLRSDHLSFVPRRTLGCRNGGLNGVLHCHTPLVWTRSMIERG
jgi:hypothetical protein